MAVTTLTVNPQVITVSGTSEHEIDWKDMLSPDDYEGTALITLLTGTSVQFNADGAITAASAALQSTDNKFILTVKRNGGNIHYKGGAGSETFSITITS